MWIVLVVIGLAIFGVWAAYKAWMAGSRMAEASLRSTPSDPDLLRKVSRTIEKRESAEGGSFWEIARAESERAGVNMWDVVDLQNADDNTKSALEDDEYQRVVNERHKFDPRDYEDLRELPTFRLKVRGMWHWVDKPASFLSGVCRLVREPENSHDRNAIEAFIGEQKVGYVAASRAAVMAPLMDEIGKPVIVGADLSGSVVVLLLPTLPGLRKWVSQEIL